MGPWQARLCGSVLELCRKGEGSFRRVENILNGRNSVNQDSEVETIGLFRAPVVYESWEEIARWWGGHGGGGGHWVWLVSSGLSSGSAGEEAQAASAGVRRDRGGTHSPNFVRTVTWKSQPLAGTGVRGLSRG